MILALALCTAAVLGCFGKQRRLATGLPPRGVDIGATLFAQHVMRAGASSVKLA